jgi:hypothetical protein
MDQVIVRNAPPAVALEVEEGIVKRWTYVWNKNGVSGIENFDFILELSEEQG